MIIIKKINYKVLINKNNGLDKNYIPKDLKIINNNFSIKKIYLRKKTKKAFEKLCKECKKHNLYIKAASGYRSYNYQKKIYYEYVKEKGKEYADLCSAKPGFSEHQTGLAIDIEGSTGTYDDFELTKEFNWISKNAYKFGFILRYPKEKENITGYKYEPWHYRYIGKRLAKKLFFNNITLEEYYKKKNKI